MQFCYCIIRNRAPSVSHDHRKFSNSPHKDDSYMGSILEVRICFHIDFMQGAYLDMFFDR